MSFEPTYKELKHYYKADPRYENLTVLSLPIRN